MTMPSSATVRMVSGRLNIQIRTARSQRRPPDRRRLRKACKRAIGTLMTAPRAGTREGKKRIFGGGEFIALIHCRPIDRTRAGGLFNLLHDRIAALAEWV